MINNRYRYARRIIRNIERQEPLSRCKHRSCRYAVKSFTIFILSMFIACRESPGYDTDSVNMKIIAVKDTYKAFVKGNALTIETMTQLCNIVNE